MKKDYIYLGLAVLAVIVLLIAIKSKEKFVMTLGKYGNPEPNICSEDAPVESSCRACSMNCSDPTNCYTCKQKMMCTQTEPSIREMPDTAGKPYIACNACHTSCNDPENCFVCKQKMNLAGVL